MEEWKDGSIRGWIDGLIYKQIDEWMDGWIDGCIH